MGAKYLNFLTKGLMVRNITIFEVSKVHTYEYDTSITTQLFADEADAKSAFENMVEKIKEDWGDYDEEDDIVVHEDMDYFDIYHDGWAALKGEDEVSISSHKVILQESLF